MMKYFFRNLLITSLYFFLSIFTYSVNAQKLVYVHGFTTTDRGLQSCNNQSTCSYWDGQELNGDKVQVGWASSRDDWRNRPVQRMVNILNNNCRNESCTIICHSTGCAITGKAIADFGGRSNWKINRVLTMGSAEGGSELANLARLVGSNGRYITPSIVRGAYNHNETRGVTFYTAAGFDGNINSFLLPGEDDGVVAYHSACGYNRVVSRNRCDSGGKWRNHRFIRYCGGDGCDRTHATVRANDIQRRALARNP